MAMLHLCCVTSGMTRDILLHRNMIALAARPHMATKIIELVDNLKYNLSSLAYSHRVSSMLSQQYSKGECWRIIFVAQKALLCKPDAGVERDNVVYWKTNRKIKNDLQWSRHQ